jgi:3-methyladenine DNA glycosylase AlkD
MATEAQVLDQLRELGKEQTRKTYRRHGVGENLFGVSFADLKALAKQIKCDHELAVSLWSTGNHDARILATMVADPALAAEAHLDEWVRDLDNYVITDAFSGYAANTKPARRKMEEWTRSGEEWIGATGWNLLAHLALREASLPDDYFLPYLELIRREIHGAKNRVRYSMNNALISIGLRSDGLREKAITTARQIGKVTVDHGETSCKTPDAITYIAKTVARKNRQEK